MIFTGCMFALFVFAIIVMVALKDSDKAKRVEPVNSGKVDSKELEGNILRRNEKLDFTTLKEGVICDNCGEEAIESWFVIEEINKTVLLSEYLKDNKPAKYKNKLVYVCSNCGKRTD